MKKTFLNLPINPFFNEFFNKFMCFFHTHKNHQLNIIKKIKKDYQKKLAKDIKIFQKKKRKKSNNMVVNVTNISQKMKKINWLSIEKLFIE